jgi:hypothetical protein
MLNPVLIASIAALIAIWCVGTVIVVRRKGPRVLWLAWIPPVIALAFLGWYFALALACAQGGGCV